MAFSRGSNANQKGKPHPFWGCPYFGKTTPGLRMVGKSGFPPTTLEPIHCNFGGTNSPQKNSQTPSPSTFAPTSPTGCFGMWFYGRDGRKPRPVGEPPVHVLRASGRGGGCPPRRSGPILRVWGGAGGGKNNLGVNFNRGPFGGHHSGEDSSPPSCEVVPCFDSQRTQGTRSTSSNKRVLIACAKGRSFVWHPIDRMCLNPLG